MSWEINFYSGVEDAITEMPPKIQARMIRILELMEEHGANLGRPLHNLSSKEVRGKISLKSGT